MLWSGAVQLLHSSMLFAQEPTGIPQDIVNVNRVSDTDDSAMDTDYVRGLQLYRTLRHISTHLLGDFGMLGTLL